MKQPFERIVETHGPTVLRVCRALLGPHDADDAWSETFISAMRAYADLPADASVEAWLVTIAHRRAIDVIRTTNRRPMPVDELPENRNTAHTNGVLDADHLDTTLELWEAVRTLPDKQRQAVAYHYVAGLPYAEVAEILGGTTDAARRAAVDGIKVLRWSGARVRPRPGPIALPRFPAAGPAAPPRDRLRPETRSYREVAELVGNPKAVRAVGTACATNPLPVVVPCHRVLRADGTLGGYIGGAEAKSTLLHLEAA